MFEIIFHRLQLESHTLEDRTEQKIGRGMFFLEKSSILIKKAATSQMFGEI